MSVNAHESKVEMVISTVPKPVLTSVFWTFYSASVIQDTVYRIPYTHSGTVLYDRMTGVFCI